MESKNTSRFAARMSARALLAAALVAPVLGQVTQRLSVDGSGAEGNGGSASASISADGRFVVFSSGADNLVPGDTNGYDDIFVRDRIQGTTERISVDSLGAQADGDSFNFAAISPDGRYVAFESLATNLVLGDTNAMWDVFVRDRQLGTTERVSIATSGAQADDLSVNPSISADGRYVAFMSRATNLVPNDTGGYYDVFLRDRLLGTTVRISVDSFGAQGNDNSEVPCISADGRFVAFSSYASNFVPGDTNGYGDIFVRDLLLGTIERVSVDSAGLQGDSDSDPYLFYGESRYISADGRYVAFLSWATNLVPGDTNASGDVFVHDRQLGTTERVSVDSSGAQQDGSCSSLSISADGRYVAFQSYATNLVPGDTGLYEDIFVHDCQLGTTERVSLDSSGAQGDGESYSPSISADGRFVTFYSGVSTFVPGDTGGWPDIFVHDRNASGFGSLCDPGSSSVSACPCSNPPAGTGRGCDNSSATGGASLSASGIAYLSMDSLVFTTSGEKPTATSIVLQGTSFVSTGIVFGQGVRCAGGTLKRLYAKTAAGGSIHAPDFGGGDPSVSARSAALGDLIHPGESRWYQVYYRDPIVLGGCPAASGFNATQGGEVAWSP